MAMQRAILEHNADKATDQFLYLLKTNIGILYTNQELSWPK